VTHDLKVDSKIDPVDIKQEDYQRLNQIQVLVDSLAKYRQEMGRLIQLLGNMREDANRVEVELAEKRRELSSKYELEKVSGGQWALDFENKQFVKPVSGTPVIP
jgi:CXXX repeat modification system protein